MVKGIFNNKLIPFLLLSLLPSLSIKEPSFCLPLPKQKYQPLYSTFLGNEQRNFYGKKTPEKLKLLWKFFIGGNFTKVGKKKSYWSGTGWTGQPTLVREFSKKWIDYLIVGCFDYKLRKINAETGKEIWHYSFNDVIKGTPSLVNKNSELLILQGSRMGFKKNLEDSIIESFRIIDFNGKEKYKVNIKRTQSYSRDVDASPLVLDSLAFVPAENGILYVINLNNNQIIKEIFLYEQKDIIKHRGNLVAEASPTFLNDRIYIAAGSGHIYGINLENLEKEWDFYIGSDLNGTISVTKDSCLIVPIEKQYISQGGVIKLNPRKNPDSALIWFSPTENKKFCNWEGGVIGSCSVQDSLVAFRAIDGYLYVINQFIFNDFTYFNNKKCKKPKIVQKIYLGPSISTPLLIEDKLITAGYDCKLKIFKKENTGFVQIDSFIAGAFESTPLVFEGKIYIGSRDGYFYCLGEKEK